jgi:predicted RNase H-like HicB family nuclease
LLVGERLYLFFPYLGRVHEGGRVARDEEQFAVIVKPNPQDGGFIATVPGHPHIVGKGETEEAALEDARIALESTPEAADAETTNGAQDPEGTPHPFDSRSVLEAIASEQGVEPADDFDALLGDFWPDDESPDEFDTALRTWRHGDGSKT